MNTTPAEERANAAFYTLTHDMHYDDAVTHLLIDIGAESIVLLVTLSVQYYLDPRDSGFRILAGIQKVHFISMTTILLVAWMTTLGYMCVYSGFDISLKFMWLEDRCENSTWLGGFEWGSEFENGTVVGCTN